LEKRRWIWQISSEPGECCDHPSNVPGNLAATFSVTWIGQCCVYMRTLLYCQHSLGIGHLVRTIHLATAMLKLGSVGVIVGGQIPAGYTFDPALKIFPLNPLSMDVEGRLFDPENKNSVKHLLEERAVHTAIITEWFCADTLIVEMFPFGRKNFSAEVLALIQNARQKPGCKVYSSVRDILVTTRLNQSKHDRLAMARLNQFFDAVLVHGDPSFARLEDTFSCLKDLTLPVYYTGYIAPMSGTKLQSIPRKNRVVVSCGGGRVGKNLSQEAVNAYDLINRELGLKMTVLAGPFVEEIAYCRKPGLQILPHINDLSSYMAESCVSVSQCGYNTSTDVLVSQTPAVFVPFETPQENEQLRRAQKFSEANRAVLLRENELRPTSYSMPSLLPENATYPET